MIKNTWLITRFTIREALSKKIFLAFFGVSSLILFVMLMLIMAFGLDELVGSMGGKQRIDGELVDMVALFVNKVKSGLTAPTFVGGLFFSIFSVAGIIPALQERGNIDIFLSKPISRTQLLMGKFIGGTAMVMINIAYLVGGIWLLIGFKFGVWDAAFLFTIITITLAFAVLYSLVIIVGLLTRSSFLAMMLSYLIFFVLSPLLLAREQIYDLISGTWQFVFDALYYIIPKTSELLKMTIELSAGEGISSWQPILTSLAFMILTLGASIIIFSKKDY